MTDQPVQPEATTKAGQAMEAWLREPENYEWGRKVTNAILAIEAEAATPDVERFRAALRDLVGYSQALKSPHTAEYIGENDDFYAALARAEAVLRETADAERRENPEHLRIGITNRMILGGMSGPDAMRLLNEYVGARLSRPTDGDSDD
jgi:hypothetical protein